MSAFKVGVKATTKESRGIRVSLQMQGYVQYNISQPEIKVSAVQTQL